MCLTMSEQPVQYIQDNWPYLTNESHIVRITYGINKPTEHVKSSYISSFSCPTVELEHNRKGGNSFLMWWAIT